MPPCAQLLALSANSRLVTSARAGGPLGTGAIDWPAVPLPRMSTSACFSKMSLGQDLREREYSMR